MALKYWSESLLSQPFWNRPAETMPRELLDEFHLKKIKSLLKFAYHNSKFYRTKWDEIGLHYEDVKSLEDFKTMVPTTDKTDFLSFQDEFPLYGHTGALQESFLSHHSQTSGSTGSPLRIPFTMYDTERYGESWIYGFWALGIRPSDSFYFAFHWGAYAGFWSAYWGVRRLGGKVFSGGDADTEGHVQNIIQNEPTVLIATPSYALRIAEKAKEMGHDLAKSSIKYTYHAGEPGPCSIEAMQDKLDKAYGAISGELLGVAELDAIAPGCPSRLGVHMNEMNNYSWTRNPATNTELPNGEIGENVITTFVNNAQPLINYRTHDLVKAYSINIPCGCGRTWRYLDRVVLGRSDYMVTVRGTNVYPSAIENLLLKIPGVTNEFQLLLTTDENGLDQMQIRMEVGDEVPSRSDFATHVQKAIKNAIGLRLEAEIVDSGSLPRTDLKQKRIVDLRAKEYRRILDRQ